MTEIKPVRIKKERKQFLQFPIDLYKNSDYFVPPIYGDEKRIFDKNYFYYETARAEYFLAYRDGKPVGRISVLIQDLSNIKNNEKRARFTRFDSINDTEVSNALFTAAENWAKEQGMDAICGPLGFSDLEREGLLIEGFDQPQTYEEQYNYDYYAGLIEAYGFVKDVDWYEYRLTSPKDEYNQKLNRIKDMIMEKYRLHTGKAKSGAQFLDKYMDGISDLLDTTYAGLYGTFPLTEGMRKSIAENFKLALNINYSMVICDENEKIVAFGIVIPGIGKAVRKSGGHLTIPCLFKLIKEIKHPSTIDLGLIGVAPEMQNTGVNAVMLLSLIDKMKEGNIKYLETNLTLETNNKVRAQFKYFDYYKTKVRRSYVKKII